MKRREMAGIQQSSSIDVPPTMAAQTPVSVEVPHTVLEVRRCGWALNRIKSHAEVHVYLHVVSYPDHTLSQGKGSVEH